MTVDASTTLSDLIDATNATTVRLRRFEAAVVRFDHLLQAAPRERAGGVWPPAWSEERRIGFAEHFFLHAGTIVPETDTSMRPVIEMARAVYTDSALVALTPDEYRARMALVVTEFLLRHVPADSEVYSFAARAAAQPRDASADTTLAHMFVVAARVTAKTK